MLIRVNFIVHSTTDTSNTYVERAGLIDLSEITYAQDRKLTPDRNIVFVRLKDGNVLYIAGTIEDIEQAIEQPDFATEARTPPATEYAHLKAKRECTEQIAAEWRQAVGCLDQIGAILGVSHTSDMNGRESLVQILRHRQLNQGFRPDGKTHGCQ